MNTGNCLENHTNPFEGQDVWALTQSEKDERLVGIPEQGVIERINDIDGKGPTNIYVDVRLKDNCSVHYPLSSIFDHKPQKELIIDSYGEGSVWV